jgi:glycosyltransferase involved in cell wall biosynthesis
MIKALVCIGLITKNVGKYLPKTLKTVEVYASLFQDYKCLIVDGYSNDSTKIIASSWCKANPDKREFLLQTTKGLDRMPSICEARNMVLTHFKQSFGKDVYLLLLDADSVSERADIEGFLNAFKTKLNWGALFPNQLKTYYDLYALRDHILQENYQLKYRHLRWDDGTMSNAMKKYQHSKEHPSGFYPVKSAFGGAGLYKTEYIKDNCVYTDKEQWLNTDDGRVYLINTCEHVTFHSCLNENGCEMFINCNWYTQEHFE